LLTLRWTHEAPRAGQSHELSERLVVAGIGSVVLLEPVHGVRGDEELPRRTSLRAVVFAMWRSRLARYHRENRAFWALARCTELHAGLQVTWSLCFVRNGSSHIVHLRQSGGDGTDHLAFAHPVGRG